MKTVLSYTLVDGGAFDEDGVANGTIVDPIYVGELLGTTASASTTTSSSGSGTLANTGTNTIAILAGGILLIVTGIAISTRGLRASGRMGKK